MSRDGKQADIKEHLANALPRPLGFRTNAMTRTIFRNSFTTSLEVPSYYKIIVGIVKILIYYMPVLGNQCRICYEKIKYYQIDEHAIIHILITLRQKLISPYVECRPSSNSFCHDIKKKERSKIRKRVGKREMTKENYESSLPVGQMGWFICVCAVMGKATDAAVSRMKLSCRIKGRERLAKVSLQPTT